jgi:hypothetical protein
MGAGVGAVQWTHPALLLHPERLAVPEAPVVMLALEGVKPQDPEEPEARVATALMSLMIQAKGGPAVEGDQDQVYRNQVEQAAMVDKEDQGQGQPAA